jgi:hypothetical protein
MKTMERLKPIDAALLEKVLGGTPAGGNAEAHKPGVVIAQARFSSFFHS